MAASGRVKPGDLGGSQWHGQAVIRISLCSWASRPEDISRSAAAFMVAREQASQHQGA